MAKKTYTISNSDNKIVNIIFILLLAVFMLIIPFYRGLFFRVNYIPAVIFISIIFTAYMIYKFRDKSCKVLDTYIDISVILIPVAYLISFFFAVNAKDALDLLLLYCSYFMLYKITSDLSGRNEKYKNIFINIIIASTFIVSLASILHIAGILEIKGALLDKRLNGPYQYPNTNASVLGVGIILALNKLINESDAKAITIYQIALTSLVPTFIFTLSRGGYLVLTGVLLLNFFLIKTRAKLKFILGFLVAFLSGSMLIYKFYTLPEESLSDVWTYYLISVIAGGLITYIIYSFKSRLKLKFTDKSINIALITVVVVFAGAAGFVFSVKEPIEYRVEHQASEKNSWKNAVINLYELEPNSKYTVEFEVKASVESPNSYGIKILSYDSANKSTEIFNHFEPASSEFTKKSFNFTTQQDTNRVAILLYNYESNSYTIYKNVLIKDSNGIAVKRMEQLKFVPAAIANRLADINLETRSVSLRTYFTKDGLKIIKDYPLIGAGGGAWKNLYRQYQSIPYNTTEVHNFYVQYGTEVGIIGIGALIALLVLIVISMVKSIKVRSQYLYVYLAAMLLLLHSSIDFNLSLVAVSYILWMLIGIINSEKNTPLIKKSTQKYIGALIPVLSFAVIIISSSIYYGMKLGAQGALTAKEGKDINKAIELYEKASTFDRYSAVYRIDLAQIMNNQLRKTKNRKYLDGFLEQVSFIRKYEPYNHEYTPTICSMYLAIGMLNEASNLADVKLKDEPLLLQSYMVKIDVNYEIASYYLKNEKVEEAIPYLEKVIKAKDELDVVNANLKEPLNLTGDYPKKLDAAFRTLEMIKADLKK